MIQTGSPDNKVRRIVSDAVFICLALAVSYLEFLLPISMIIPIPGFKLGLANIVIIFVAFNIGFQDAILVGFIKNILVYLLFGNVTSLLFSTGGLILSLIVILNAIYWLYKTNSWIGISVLSAVAHNIGQLIVAIFTIGEVTVLWYLPYLIFSGIICGLLTGILLMVSMNKLSGLYKKIYLGGKTE